MSWNSSRYEYVTQSLRSSGDTQVRATAALPQLNPLNFMLCAIWCTKIWISPTKLREWVLNMSKTIHSYKQKRKAQLLNHYQVPIFAALLRPKWKKNLNVFNFILWFCVFLLEMDSAQKKLKMQTQNHQIIEIYIARSY